MKKLFKKIGRSQGVLFSLVQSSAIAAVVLLAVSHVSCKMTETGISVSEGESRALRLGAWLTLLALSLA